MVNKKQGEIGDVWGVPEHLYHFSRNNLEILLDNTGFKTKKIIASATLTNIFFNRKEKKRKEKTPAIMQHKNDSENENTNKSIIKMILHNPIILPIYKSFRENRVLWEKLGIMATIFFSPINSIVWVYSIKKNK